MALYSEKDIEDYLYTHPWAIDYVIGPYQMYYWFRRQLRLPSGILDLVGIASYEHRKKIVLIELKLSDITSEALTQVCRYEADLIAILELATAFSLPKDPIIKVVIGSKVSDKVFRESQALGISLAYHSFAVCLSHRLRWNKEEKETLNKQYMALAENEDFEEMAAAFPRRQVLVHEIEETM